MYVTIIPCLGIYIALARGTIKGNPYFLYRSAATRTDVLAAMLQLINSI